MEDIKKVESTIESSSEKDEIVTWGVKVPSSLREEMKKAMSDSGLKGETFLENLLTMFKLDSSKKDDEKLSSSIEELQTLNKRINNIFIDLVEHSKIKADDVKNNSEKAISIKDAEIKELQEKIEQYKLDLKEVREELSVEKNNSKALVKELDELKNTFATTKDLNIALKDKNDNLNAENKKLIEDTKVLVELKKSNEGFSSKIAELESIIFAKNNEIQGMKKEKEFELRELKLTIEIEKNKELQELQGKLNAEKEDKLTIKTELEKVKLQLTDKDKELTRLTELNKKNEKMDNESNSKNEKLTGLTESNSKNITKDKKGKSTEVK